MNWPLLLLLQSVGQPDSTSSLPALPCPAQPLDPFKQEAQANQEMERHMPKYKTRYIDQNDTCELELTEAMAEVYFGQGTSFKKKGVNFGAHE